MCSSLSCSVVQFTLTQLDALQTPPSHHVSKKDFFIPGHKYEVFVVHWVLGEGDTKMNKT